jgi:hypothetical protein
MYQRLRTTSTNNIYYFEFTCLIFKYIGIALILSWKAKCRMTFTVTSVTMCNGYFLKADVVHDNTKKSKI